MTDIESRIKFEAEKAILKIVSSGSWIQPDFRNRVKLPAEFMEDVWGLVDTEKVKKQLAVRLERELADRIVNSMAAEMASDIKQVLSVKERREAVRSVVRENIDRLTKGENQ